ncbi:MAG TPA: tail fiber domain-containing protein [Flavobacteriales bacterium]|nr:tail fiber domain-containing protein [Flavobacteriales bacterium]
MKTKKLMLAVFAIWYYNHAFSQQWLNGTGYIYLNTLSDRVNIGGSTLPSFKLDVLGDMNLNTSTNIYRIGGSAVLWQNSAGTSIFVGKGAGASAVGTANNTFVGVNAGGGGGIVTTGSTSLGFNSGSSLTTGDYNLFAGYESGKYVTTGAQNVFLGKWAGVDNTGSSGTTSGDGNIFIGYSAGKSNTTTDYNTAIGFNADIANGLTNANAIGYNSVANASNSLILGNNDVSVGLGYSGASLVANTKFNVLYSTGSSLASGSGNNHAGHFLNSNYFGASPGTNPYIHGVWAEANGNESSTAVYHYGGSFRANNAYKTVAVSGVASSKPYASVSTLAYGGYFNASHTSGSSLGANYGVYATVGSQVFTNIAIYGTVTSYANGNYAGFFNGDIYTQNGINSGTGWISVSDRQFKKDIANIDNPMKIIKQLNPQSYYFNNNNDKGMHFTEKKQFGFIAQELEKVLPDLVYDVTRPEIRDVEGNLQYEKLDHKAVNYDGFIAFLVAGMQEQQKQIDELKQALAASPSGAGMNNALPSTTIELSDKYNLVLDQNVPNPFAEQTTITYSLPENVQKAQLLFYNAEGRLINSAELEKIPGNGQLNVFASDLSNGTYTYTLVVDGRIMGTKKMTRNK